MEPNKKPQEKSQKKLIAPSILAADFANLEKEIVDVTVAGADWIHVDVMDGHFVDNITIGAPVVNSLRKISKIPLDVHLMIENPEKYIQAFVDAGSDYLTIHVESTNHTAAILRKIRELGVKAGISLRPGTPLLELIPFLGLVDLVLVMTVEPGFGGQSFLYDQVPKISELKKMREQNNYQYLIEVDGGVNEKTFSACVDADVLVAGNFVFKNNYSEAIQTLKGELTSK